MCGHRTARARVGGRLSTDADILVQGIGSCSHQQRMKGLDRAPHTMHVQPLCPTWGPVTAVGYGFTDLRIYAPLSPSRRADRPRDIEHRIKLPPDSDEKPLLASLENQPQLCSH